MQCYAIPTSCHAEGRSQSKMHAGSYQINALAINCIQLFALTIISLQVSIIITTILLHKNMKNTLMYYYNSAKRHRIQNQLPASPISKQRVRGYSKSYITLANSLAKIVNRCKISQLQLAQLFNVFFSGNRYVFQTSSICF